MTRTGPRRRANRDGTKKPIKRWAYDPRSRTDWRNETALRKYPTYDWSRASGRAGGRDREFWRCVYKKRCSHEWKDWCAAKGKGPSVITPMSCRPEPLGWAQYEPQERKPHQCNRRVDCMDVAGVLIYDVVFSGRLLCNGDASTRELPHPAHESAIIRCSVDELRDGLAALQRRLRGM